jgi:hypothetical protein
MSTVNTRIDNDVSLAEAIELIATIGKDITVLLEGHMGNGKTSATEKALAERFPDHAMCHFDCTTKDLGDLLIPKILEAGNSNYVTFATNEELGVHLNQRVMINLDEVGKSQAGVKKALTRLILERKIGTHTLHPDSIVYGTTNLSEEGVGDFLEAHQLDRICKVRIRKSTHVEWIDWGIANNINPAILGFVREFPQVLQSFEDVVSPEDNMYIYHPQAEREAFVTPRSLEMASKVLDSRDLLSKGTLRAALAGTIGVPAMRDLVAFIDMADQLPSLDEIKDSPETATVPTSASAVCMVVYRALSVIERDWVGAWMTYLNRLNPEAQMLFVNGVKEAKYTKLNVVASEKKFTEWCLENHHLFS